MQKVFELNEEDKERHYKNKETIERAEETHELVSIEVEEWNM